MKTIEVFGTGCAKCKQLADNATEAAKAANVEFELKKVTDVSEMAGRGVMLTPALAIDGQIRAVGKVPSAADIQNMLAD